jgi:hypothetical protein
MRKRAFFRSSKLMLPGAVIGAWYRPGFSHDLSGWRLVVDDEGNLFQDVNVLQWSPERGRVQERRQEHVEIGPDAVPQLLIEAQEMGFSSYESSYDLHVTDQESYILSIRFGEIDKTVEAYGAQWLAREGNQDMIGFLKLWRSLHRHAPFPPSEASGH